MATAQDLDSRLLRAWRAAKDRTFVPDPSEWTPDTLAARVRELRAAGFVIEGPLAPGGGYRLVTSPAHLVADDLRAGLLEDAVVGREILAFEETDSTNDLAAQAGRDGIAEGLTIFAESQRAGRGRMGRKWVSPPGLNLLFSVLLRPSTVSVERWPELTFCAALAVAETAEHFTGLPARIKWPNDVLLAGRKVAGILLESHQTHPPGFVVVGIGLNVLQHEDDFPVELRDRAGSLAMSRPDGGEELDRREVAAFVLGQLGRLYARWPGDRTTIRAACVGRGCALPPG